MKKIQAKHITDAELLEAITKAQKRQVERGWDKPLHLVWAMMWDVEEFLSHYPAKVVHAKLRSALKRRLIEGCECMKCRGDFFIPSCPEEFWGWRK